MSLSFAAEGCSVEIYPFEGGSVALQGGQIQAVTVSKSLLGGTIGRFSIELAPGGPRGPEDPDTWSKIITPMSHVLIGMNRGDDAAIVMDGVATGMGEAQAWHTTAQGAEASRGQGVSGGDFAWFFRTFNYYALTYYGLAMGTGFGGALDLLPAPLVAQLSKGAIGGTNSQNSNPVQVGRVWYQDIMAGQNGILNKTYVPFANGSRLTFSSIMSANWENYPNVYIPLAENFMVSEESWMEKFQTIFPHPWYEFFVTTAPVGAYPVYGGAGYTDKGTQIQMQTMPQAAPAGPILVARVNPVPAIGINLNNGNPVTGAIDVSRWTALPLLDFTQYPYGFISSDVSFSAEGARNFYQLNPTHYMFTFGANNSNTTPAPLLFPAGADAASIQRYGFRPQIGTIRWLMDQTGIAAQVSTLNFAQTIVDLTGRMISWFHPAPLMADARVIVPLLPSVLVGTRFRYAPFKDGVEWDFYVEGFQHRFVFGGRSTTTLTLSRGLPRAVYDSTADGGLLLAIHLGNAMRQAADPAVPPGEQGYKVGLPTGTGPALTFIVTPQQVAQLNQQIGFGYVTPQPK